MDIEIKYKDQNHLKINTILHIENHDWLIYIILFKPHNHSVILFSKTLKIATHAQGHIIGVFQ